MYHVFICLLQKKKRKKKSIRAIYKFREREGTVWKNNVIHANFNLGLCISFSFRNHGLEMFRYLCKASVVSMVLIQKKYSRNKYWTSQELIWLTYNNKGKSIRSNEGYWQVLFRKKKKTWQLISFFFFKTSQSIPPKWTTKMWWSPVQTTYSVISSNGRTLITRLQITLPKKIESMLAKNIRGIYVFVFFYYI